MCCRKYQEIYKETSNARVAFCRRHTYKNGRRGALFPPGLEEIPSFAT